MKKAKEKLIGDFGIGLQQFSRIDLVFKQFQEKDFLRLSDRRRSERVNLALVQLIQQEAEPCFLLPCVLRFVERVDREKILDHYTFTSFELWLNQYSGLSFEENYRVRAKIAGKWVARSDYQALFPIGMGKIYEGSHFVTAHKSPDLDTTVASFWGWVDAFAARVGDGLHLWNLPGGPPDAIEIEWMFRDPLSNAVFTHLAKTRTALNLTGNDLMSQKGLIRRNPSDSIVSIDHEHKAVIIVDEEGFYLGDWRSADVEGGRQVVILLTSCVDWFENQLHLQVISLFAEEAPRFDEIGLKLRLLYELKIQDCELVLRFSTKQRKQIHDFIALVLGVEEGEGSSFETLISRLTGLTASPFEGLREMLHRIRCLFDAEGRFLEDRPKIFRFLENAVKQLHEAISQIRERLDQLDIALKAKREVFGRHPSSVTVRSDVEEIRSKMGSYLSLTVTYPDRGKLFPVGVIQAADLRKTILGTVSLRDFCNREEMTIPSCLEVISVIDHHKSQLKTFSPPTAIIADTQSCNTLVAIQAFVINDRVSLGGQSVEGIQQQIDACEKHSSGANRLLQRLLKRQQAALASSSFFVHPEREKLEYLHFLYAILDDTDLLSKVSALDVECAASLLNRLKTLSAGREMEIVSLDDLPRDQSFPKKAAKRILQNEEMYSLYRKVYAFREQEVERNIDLCVEGRPSNIFADTKELNGCCRVGQTKIFPKNVPYFFKHADAIGRIWLDMAKAAYRDKPEVDLHIHMISTVVSAEEVYQGTEGSHTHKDELWLWIPPEEAAIERLKRFLSAFQASPGLKAGVEVEFSGENGEDLASIFKESFLDVPCRIVRRGLPLALLRFKAGALNSRKAMVSPFLPSLSSD